MALATIESRRLGLAKEASRGVAESAPDRWRAVTVDSELEYALALIQDETKRGISAKFPAAPGVKSGQGTVKFPVRASEVGEFFHMLSGDPTSVLDSTALAFKHTFNLPVTGIQPPSYTAFLDRGLSVKAYQLVNASQVTISGDQEGLAQMEAAVMFQSEAAGAIGSPDYSGESEEFTSYQAKLSIDTVQNTQIKTYSFQFANGLFPQRTLNNSQDIKDLIAAGPFTVTGSFEVYLENETERAKFLAATQSALELLIEGDLIEDTSKYTLKLDLPKIKYTAFPFGEMDGLLGVAAEFEAEYDTATSKLATVEVINQKTSY